MNNLTKILCIAPYEGLRSLITSLSKTHTDIDIDVFVGDMEKGVEVAKRNFNENYDVIISRGGTAELLSTVTSIPIVEISLSVYDILRAIKLAENYAASYAIVGFPSITNCAKVLCDLLQYKIDIFTIHNENEASYTLANLKLKGYTMILCDMICNTKAKAVGLNSILITSGKESIESAFEQAIKTSLFYKTIEKKTDFLLEVITGESNHTIIFDSEGNEFFSTVNSKKGISIENPEQIIKILKRKIPELLKSKSQRFFKNISNNLYSIRGETIICDTTEYVVFYIDQNSPPAFVSKYGISYFNKDDIEAYLFNSFYNVTNYNSNLKLTIDEFSNHNLPIMITGEVGTGKGEVARTLYMNSQINNHPFIMINCKLINNKTWNYLTNHYNSPFLENDITIYIRNIESLEEDMIKQLLTLILDIKLHKRNKIIFSCDYKVRDTIPNFCMEYINLLSCLTLSMPTLRTQLDSIPTLSSIYIGTANINMAKQIIGFEPEAMNIMESYNWPFNHSQLRRVLNELSLLTTTPYITADNVYTILNKENTLLNKANNSIDTIPIKSISYGNIDLDKTLNEINREIIDIVLKKLDGNQSAAAKSLGISRTTLWRYLK